MVKSKILFVCQTCGFDSPKWLGRCPGCEAWNTMVEERVKQEAPARFGPVAKSSPQSILTVDFLSAPRRVTGIQEFDRVMGGGIVPGSLTLIGGDPGIGKSTLSLAVADAMSRKYGNVLYVTGEESAAQIRMRAERIGALSEKLLVLTETNIDEIISAAERIKPVYLVIDSIQTMFSPDIPSTPGSVGQVRETTAKLIRFSKDTGVSCAIIGHVTKEGNIAGPKLLEHMVDVVLYFEGERQYSFRVLRAMKNRFGDTSESGIFAMEATGLIEVRDPSRMLLSERPAGTPGSVVMACVEGVRPLLIEIQSLVSTSCYGMPRRMTSGFDYNRVTLLLAVLEKRCGLMLGNQDVYVNTVGGVKINEPAADLAVMLAVVSSFQNKNMHPSTVAFGEVGLTGEVRMVSRADLRVKEASSLGFTKFIVPFGNMNHFASCAPDIEVVGVKTVSEALEEALL